jgi:hypothetical protein
MFLSVSCANSTSDGKVSASIAKGRRIGAQEAAALLTSASRWCYDNTESDAFFGTHVFSKTGRGEFAVWSKSKQQFVSRDAMTWKIEDDVLTMTLPATYKPRVWTAHLRVIDQNLQLWQNDQTLNSVLHSCQM